MSSSSPKKKSPPSPAPTVTLDPNPKRDLQLQRSSSEDSIRVIHHAVLFPSSPNAGRVTYIRRLFETDEDIIKRQLAMIATQPLTYAEELKARRKQLEQKAEKRKQEKEKAAAETANKGTVPEIAIIPASGKQSLPSTVTSPVKARIRDRTHSTSGKMDANNSTTMKSKTANSLQKQNHLSVRNAIKKKVNDKPKEKVAVSLIGDTVTKTSK